MLSEKAKSLIAEQRRLYIASMPDKKQVIRRCMQQVKTAVRTGEPDLCDKLFLQVHRLAGSAGIFGFDSLGDAALSVDRFLTAHSSKAWDMEKLAVLLQILLNEIDKVVRDHS